VSCINRCFIIGESKVESEKIIKDIHRDQGLDYVILRPTGLFGVGDDFAMYELIKAVDFGLFFFIPGVGTAKLMYVCHSHSDPLHSPVEVCWVAIIIMCWHNIKSSLQVYTCGGRRAGLSTIYKISTSC
jgi:nucleoside-diphosphate-sugar epimerase